MENDNATIVRAALAGDPVETERLFNSRMTDVLADRIDTMRKDVATSILTPPEQEPSSDETDHE